MSALAREAVPGLRPRDEIIIKYAGYDEWHARILLSEISPALWIVVTPDADIYPEDLGPSNRDIEQWRRRIPGRPPPYGIRSGDLYDFSPRPGASDLDQMCAEADIRAAMVRGDSPGIPPRRRDEHRAGLGIDGAPDHVEPEAPPPAPAHGAGRHEGGWPPLVKEERVRAEVRMTLAPSRFGLGGTDSATATSASRWPCRSRWNSTTGRCAAPDPQDGWSVSSPKEDTLRLLTTPVSSRSSACRCRTPCDAARGLVEGAADHGLL